MTADLMPQKDKLKVMITSGVSCPDALVVRVIARVAELSHHLETLEALSQ